MLEILQRVPVRLAYFLGALACIGLLGYGYVLQYFQGQDPCPLCLVQRVFYALFALAFIAGAVHAPKGRWNLLYGGLGLAAALAGGGTAARQVWLQHLPPDQVPQCGPDLQFMIQHFPLSRTLENLFIGSGDCAEVHWRFLGLSIAEWSLAWFAALALYALWLAARRR